MEPKYGPPLNIPIPQEPNLPPRAVRSRSGGWRRLDAAQRGGRPPKLDAKALKWIYYTVTMKNPLTRDATA